MGGGGGYGQLVGPGLNRTDLTEGLWGGGGLWGVGGTRPE